MNSDGGQLFDFERVVAREVFFSIISMRFFFRNANGVPTGKAYYQNPVILNFPKQKEVFFALGTASHQAGFTPVSTSPLS